MEYKRIYANGIPKKVSINAHFSEFKLSNDELIKKYMHSDTHNNYSENKEKSENNSSK
jgi:hypothetical protein